jgi:steroid 5-alpha reductase family enzyme
MNNSMISLLLISLAIGVTYFFFTWLVSVKIKNYGLLDVAWSYGVALLAPLYAWMGDGWPLRKWLGLALGAAWSLRLGTYILVRVIKHHPAEDERYQTLRARWPGPGMFLCFFQLQAVLVVIFALPFLILSFHTRPEVGLLECLGWALAVISLIGESLADAQLKRFKQLPSNRGKVCAVGLWRYSRHPNYFFEALIQVAFCLMAWSAPYGWVTLLNPLLMLYFLLRVTGIPLTEEHALRSKGEAYRQYQRTTNALIPWPPKSL